MIECNNWGRMKIHLFLAAAVGLAITVTTSHAALGRSLDETIQHYGRPTKGPEEINLRRDHQGVGTVFRFDGIGYTISTSGIVDICFDGGAQVLWDV
jgi:hypothetical protein